MVVKKLEKAFKMNNEFMKVIKEEALKLNIESTRSNSIGSQIACLLGARDAYGKCIVSDTEFSWNPDFKHSDRYNHTIINKHAYDVSNKLINQISGLEELSDNQSSLIIDLISHEYLHQGQLIRYIYANDLEMPKEMKSFWHLED